MAKILVIEDDHRFGNMVRLALTDAQHLVVLARDGAEGLKLFKADTPDLVISDIIMPNKEGIETIREIRGIAPTTPIIAMSGGSASIGPQYLSAAQKLGANAILSKPFRASELIELVTNLLKTE